MMNNCSKVLWTSSFMTGLTKTVTCSATRYPSTDSKFRGGLLQHVAQDVVKLAKEGLSRRGRNEGAFLAPLEEVVTTGESLAQLMLNPFLGDTE